MSDIHIIRLREPWETKTLPDGAIEFRRRFGKPHVSDPTEQIWLVCPGDSTVELNGERIPSVCDVTTRLLPRNELVIVAHDALDTVHLEIRTPA